MFSRKHFFNALIEREFNTFIDHRMSTCLMEILWFPNAHNLSS